MNSIRVSRRSIEYSDGEKRQSAIELDIAQQSDEAEEVAPKKTKGGLFKRLKSALSPKPRAPKSSTQEQVIEKTLADRRWNLCDESINMLDWVFEPRAKDCTGEVQNAQVYVKLFNDSKEGFEAFILRAKKDGLLLEENSMALGAVLVQIGVASKALFDEYPEHLRINRESPYCELTENVIRRLQLLIGQFKKRIKSREIHVNSKAFKKLEEQYADIYAQYKSQHKACNRARNCDHLMKEGIF